MKALFTNLQTFRPTELLRLSNLLEENSLLFTSNSSGSFHLSHSAVVSLLTLFVQELDLLYSCGDDLLTWWICNWNKTTTRRESVHVILVKWWRRDVALAVTAVLIQTAFRTLLPTVWKYKKKTFTERMYWKIQASKCCLICLHLIKRIIWINNHIVYGIEVKCLV